MFPNNFAYAACALGAISNNSLGRIALKAKQDDLFANKQGRFEGAEV